MQYISDRLSYTTYSYKNLKSVVGQGHLNLIASFPRPNNVSLALWSKSMHWFTRYTADKAHILIVWWPWKLGQIVYLSQWCNTWSLVWIHHLVQAIGCRQAFVESNFDIKSAGVTFKMRSRSPNLITSFLSPSNVSVQVWWKSTDWLRR